MTIYTEILKHYTWRKTKIQSNLSNSNLYNSNSWIIRSFLWVPLQLYTYYITFLIQILGFFLFFFPFLSFFWWSLQLQIRQVWLYFKCGMNHWPALNWKALHQSWLHTWGQKVLYICSIIFWALYTLASNVTPVDSTS